MPFSGPSQFPYWIAIQNDGTHSTAGMQSEQFPVIAGSTYSAEVTWGYDSTWAAGAQVSLTVYNAAGTQVAAAAGGSTVNMTGGLTYTAGSGTVTAPPGAAYALALVTQNGLPASTNNLKVYQGQVNDQTSTAVNVNYNFTWNFWPWSAVNSALLTWNYNPRLTGDFDSLVLDGQVELMGGPGGVPASLPELADANGQGPVFRILAPPAMNSAALGYQASYDLNAPQPTQDVVASLLLDGERPFGTRSSNRQMSLPVIIFGTQAGGMKQVLAAREYLMAVIDQQTWTIRWTPADTGLPMLFDCFRALPSVPVYGFNYSAGGSASDAPEGRPNCPIALITLSIQALPFGRSDLDGVQSLQFTNGLVSGPALASATTVDNFTDFTQGANPGWALDTTTSSPLGGNSVKTFANAATVLPLSTTTYHGTLSAPVSIAGLPTLSASFGQVYDGKWVFQPVVQSNVTLSWALTDNHGKTLSFHQTYPNVRWSRDIRNPYWTTLNAAIPQNARNFNYSQVASYTLTISNTTSGGRLAFDRMICFLNSVTAQPQTITNQSSPRGTVYNLFGLPGSARAPVSLHCQLPAAAPVVKELATPGSGTWQVPAGVYSVAAEGWAGGGAGASTASYEALALDNNAVLLAMLDANASDASGNGYNGTATSVTFGQANTGIAAWHSALFNGTSSGITFPVNPYGGKAYTLSAWVNPSGSAAQGRVIATSHTDVGSDNAGFELYVNSTHFPVAAFGNGSANGVAAGGATVPATGWTHLAATYDGATVRLYVNGAQAATAALTGAVAPGLAGKVSAGFGAVNNSDFFTGLIQGVAVMQEALTATQMLALYQSGAPIGGGGGGGEYAAEAALAVGPGTKVPWTVGTGGVPAQLAPTVIRFAKDGVVSHWTCPANVTSVLAECWGGGAAGAAGGGGGGGGEYSAQQFTVVPGTTYWIFAAPAGTANTGTSSADNFARNGGISWFGNSGTKASASALISARGGVAATTGGTPGGKGGSGSTASVHFNGGGGGSSPGTGGGGGGGAAGNQGTGGRGGDSPANSAPGKFAGGGTHGNGAGEGNSSGGSGGAGSSAPGFPGRGSAPGGGGGGGYSGPILTSKAQPSEVNLNGAANYLGADGGTGAVQLSYTVNGGSAVNGGNTTFGSAGTTGTTVTAHGGTSSAANTLTPSAGGSGSANAVHGSGGTGGLFTSGANGSWFTSPYLARTSSAYALQLGGSGTYATGSGTSSVAAASCAQGVSIVLVRSKVPVTDLAVSDTSGNDYVPVADQAGGSAQGGITTYAFTANIASPVTTSTTITISSATAQAYGYLWYTSPTLVSGVTAPNLATSSGTGSTITGTFGAGDEQSMQYQLVVASNDASATPSAGQPLFSNALWYAANATSSVTDSSGIMQAFIGLNQGGGAAGVTGDAFSCGMSASSNWSALCIPLVAAAQQASMVKLFTAGNNGTPGASTSWTADCNISPAGYIAVVGQSLSGAPSGIVDASGNAYALASSQQLGSANVRQWMFTAPVTQALAQGVTGAIHWGSASAAPEWRADAFWLPNATGLDPAGVTTVTGSGTAASGTYQPYLAGDELVAFLVNYNPTGTEHATAGHPGAPWNQVEFEAGPLSNVNGDLYLAQATDLAAIAVTGFAFPSATSWSLMLAGFGLTTLGAGGGAAGGPSGAGYPAASVIGAPGYAGGAHGGNAGAQGDSPGDGGAVPGGGGGGAYSTHASTAAQSGGGGGAGMIRLTWQPPLTPFNTLVLHRPGENSPPNFSPLVPVPVTDLPNNKEYTVAVPSDVPYLNAEFSGTYTVLLSAYAWNSPTAGSARTLTVTVNQYEYPGGPRYSIQASRAVTPALDVVNGLVNLGEVTLPLKDYAAHNDQSYFTVSLMDSDQGDSFQDVLFLDSTGQTAIINIAPGTPGYGQYVSYYVDEPTADRDLGFVGATTQGRQHQVSVLEYAMLSGGPFYITPGDNLLLAYCPAGAPEIGLTYAPRWYLDRIQ